MKLLALTVSVGLLLGAFAIEDIRAQDTVQTLVLSPRVGPRISSAERREFNLFPQYGNFVEATVFRMGSGGFFVRFTLNAGEAVNRDTVVAYGSRTLLVIAEKINHYEELAGGSYRMGDDRTCIKTEDGDTAIATWSTPVDSSSQYALASEQTDAWADDLSGNSELTVGLTSGMKLENCSLDSLDGGSLILNSGKATVQVPVDSILFLVREKESHFWTGAGIGLLAGAAVGSLIGLATYERPQRQPGQWIYFDFGPGMSAFGGAVIGMPAGFLTGGIVGASMGGDEMMSISNLSREAKIDVLRRLITACKQ